MSGPVWYWVRIAARNRRRAAVVLALLTVLGTVVPLVAAAGARRTATSVDRMRAELLPAHADVQFDGGPPPADVLDRFASMPGVDMVAEGASILARPVGSDAELFESFGQGGLDGQLGHGFDLARLDEGRLPRTSDEVFLSRRQADELRVGVGDTVELETFTPEAIDRIFAGEPVTYDGPHVQLRIVGVGRQPEEITAGADSPSPRFVVAPAFFEKWEGQVHWFDGIYLFRLDGGTDAVGAFFTAARAEFPDREDLTVHASQEAARIDDAVSAQTTALALLAAVALLTGTLAIGQAAVRLARSAEPEGQVLAALGLDRRQLGVARAGLVAGPIAIGVLVAVGLAVTLSGLFPNGPAGRVEPTPGIRADVMVLAVGAIVTMVAAIGATLVLARPGVDRGPARPSRIGEAVGRSLPSLAAAVGVQGALRRTGGPASASTRSAMLAIGGGVAGLVGSLVFASSLGRLVDEPARFGWNWDYEVGLGDELSDAEAVEQAQALTDDPRLDGILYARLATRDLAGHPTVVFGLEPLAGDLQLTIVKGRSVRSDDEIVLGGTVLDALDTHVGGTIRVDLADGPRDLRVVGQGLFPTNEDDDAAAGAAVTLETMAGLSGTGGFPDLFVTSAPGVDQASLRADLEEQLGATTGAVAPPVVGNLELVASAPYLLAAYLTLLGIAASAHAIVMVVRLRRSELAMLRGLGFDRRQVSGTVLAHSTAIAVVGVVAGLPIGLAVGRLAWRLVASGLGFATDPHTPMIAVAAVVPGAILLALLIALGPALWAARQSPGTILRTE